MLCSIGILLRLTEQIIVEGRMIRIGMVLAAAVLAAGCTTTPKAPEGPALVGKVKSQPGNCYYKDATGKLFISPCK